MGQHVAWDYSDLNSGYYHIYGVTVHGDGLLHGKMIFNIPETPHNSDDVEVIADALDRIAARSA